MNYRDILQNAPRFLTMRYNSLNSYVWEMLFSEEYRKKVLSKFDNTNLRKKEYARMKSISEEATLLVFIFSIRNFLLEGSRMAKTTVDILKSFNVPGFNLGKSFFSERNENVILGDKLSDELYNLLDEKAKLLIGNSEHIYEILDAYKVLTKEIYG